MKRKLREYVAGSDIKSGALVYIKNGKVYPVELTGKHYDCIIVDDIETDGKTEKEVIDSITKMFTVKLPW